MYLHKEKINIDTDHNNVSENFRMVKRGQRFFIFYRIGNRAPVRH